MAFAYLKHYYGCSDDEIYKMSMYKVQKYIEHISKILGQTSDKEESKEQVIPATKIDNNKELIKQAKGLGLKVPKYY